MVGTVSSCLLDSLKILWISVTSVAVFIMFMHLVYKILSKNDQITLKMTNFV